MGIPQAGFLLKYFDTSGSDPITLEQHLGWLDSDPPTGSPENLGYGDSVAPLKPYYFGPWSPSNEQLARLAQTFGDRLSDTRMAYFKVGVVVTPGKDGDTGVGGTRITRTKTGERYLAVRILDHAESGKIVRAIFMREQT